ncbi:flippase [Aliidiomarina shirensis]|uniref:Flippase n=1 Tax=Aliidiomarina shirensis TaxID=1048642 RepID=A0A432WU83_9GAMM|nr:lipopolysaccharide biosynthesis protein [Aliidiomarina shirensis]RUO37325.1 flippase [Aliidiomarina shirensis]
MSLSLKTSTGILWNLCEQFARRGIGILVTLLLARFLVPEDFGLVAMMAVFIALGSSLMESGFREALIRLEKITQEDYTTAFYANLALGLFSYIILALVAPSIASFYDEPRLVELIRVASLSVIIMSFQVVQVASLSRKLNFKAQLKASFPASIISGAIAIYLAYLGWGVWALVGHTLLNAFLHTALLWRIEAWRPTMQFSWKSAKAMYNFGYKLFLSGMLDTVFQNLYVIVIAKAFSASAAGLYFFATKIRDLIVQQLIVAIQSVTYPALSSVQNDAPRLKLAYKKIVILMTLAMFPMVIFIAAFAQHIFELILPAKWWPAVPYFQLLCAAALMMPLHSINLNILKVKGRSDLFLYLEIIKKLVNGAVLLATYQYGIHAIIIGQIATSVVNYIPNSYFSSKLLGYGIIEQVKDFLPTLLIALVAVAVSYQTVQSLNMSGILLLISAALIACVMYVALLFILKRSAFNVLVNYVQQTRSSAK